MTRGRRIELAIVVVVIIGLVLICLGADIPGIDIAFLLAAGWVPFLLRVGREVTFNWDLVGSAAVYVLLLIAGAHLFLRWLYREMTPKPAAAGTTTAGRPAWRFRWTLGGAMVVLLIFAAGTAMTGVVHQVAWLARSPDSLYLPRQNRREMAMRIKCLNNLRIIGQALSMYAIEHGQRFPDDFPALMASGWIEPEHLICPSSNDVPATGQTRKERLASLSESGHCSYIYVGKGLSAAAADRGRIVAFEPARNHDEELVNVLFADGHVEDLMLDTAGRVLAEQGIDRTSLERSPVPDRPTTREMP